jgi:hypothetical protein
MTSLPSTRPHLLKALPPPNIITGWWPVLWHMGLWGLLLIQSIVGIKYEGTLIRFKQARIRESSGLLEHIWLEIVFQIEHSSLSRAFFSIASVGKLFTP